MTGDIASTDFTLLFINSVNIGGLTCAGEKWKAVKKIKRWRKDNVNKRNRQVGKNRMTVYQVWNIDFCCVTKAMNIPRVYYINI